MSDLTLEIVKPLLTINQVAKEETLEFPGNFPTTAADVKAWIEGRPEYTSNAAASIDLDVGETYWAAAGNIEVAEGTFMRVV